MLSGLERLTAIATVLAAGLAVFAWFGDAEHMTHASLLVVVLFCTSRAFHALDKFGARSKADYDAGVQRIIAEKQKGPPAVPESARRSP